MRDLPSPVQAFPDRSLKGRPEAKDSLAVTPDLLRLRDAVSHSGADGVHAAQRRFAWSALIRAAGAAARGLELEADASAWQAISEILLDGWRDWAARVKEQKDEESEDG